MTSFVPLSPCSVNVVGGAWGQLTDLQASLQRQSVSKTNVSSAEMLGGFGARNVC